MSSEILISSMVILTLLECIQDHGLGVDEIKKQTGLTQAQIDDPDIHISLSTLMLLWEMAVKASGDPALGIHLRGLYGKNLLHFTSYIGMNSSNGLEALKNFSHYAKLICKVHRFELREEGDCVIINYTITSPVHQNSWMPEYDLASLVYYGRVLFGDSFNLEEIRFQHASSTAFEVYEAFFRSPVLFQNEENAIVIKKQLLLREFENSNPHLLKTLKSKAESDLMRLSEGKQTTLRVQEHIVRSLPTGCLNFESTAEALNIGRSSLYRALKEEKTTFNSLLKEIRKDLAESYLKQGMNISQIAYQTGYTDVSNFQHAFKQWFGKNPGIYRKEISSS
jgi:AraC-like DNA-binding protein